MHLIKNILKYKFSLIWLVIIFILCLLPSKDFTKNNFSIPQLDKIVHFSMFFILTILLNFEKKTKKFKENLLKTIIISVTIALLTEISQKTLTTDRQFDLLDLISDVSGSLVGYITYLKLRMLNKK